MSSNLDIYNEFYEASWANPPSSNVEAVLEYYADDFHSLDIDGNVQMNKEAYMGLVQLLFSAFADFTTKKHDLREDGDCIILSSHFEGTHTGDLDLTAMGLGVIPASGKKIVWPVAKTEWKFEGGKIKSIRAADDAGGMGPFLAALGVTPPSG